MLGGNLGSLLYRDVSVIRYFVSTVLVQVETLPNAVFVLPDVYRLFLVLLFQWLCSTLYISFV